MSDRGSGVETTIINRYLDNLLDDQDENGFEIIGITEEMQNIGTGDPFRDDASPQLTGPERFVVYEANPVHYVVCFFVALFAGLLFLFALRAS